MGRSRSDRTPDGFNRIPLKPKHKKVILIAYILTGLPKGPQSAEAARFPQGQDQIVRPVVVDVSQGKAVHAPIPVGTPDNLFFLRHGQAVPDQGILLRPPVAVKVTHGTARRAGIPRV